MLHDKKNLFCDATSISTSAATHTALIGDVVDMGPLATGNTSILTPDRAGLFLHLRVTAAAVSTAAGTLAISWQTADNSAMTSASTVFTAVPAAVASVGWTKGAVYNIPLPEGTYKRYNQLYLTGAAHIVTAGALTAVLADVPARYVAAAQDASVF